MTWKCKISTRGSRGTSLPGRPVFSPDLLQSMKQEVGRPLPAGLHVHVEELILVPNDLDESVEVLCQTKQRTPLPVGRLKEGYERVDEILSLPSAPRGLP